MLRITGYSDRYALCPGEEIKFYINSENGESYNADIVRMIHGDTNPDGPGFKVEELDTQVSKEYAGRNQIIHGGSYAVVPHDHRMNVESFTLQAFIFPTTPDKGVQGILTKCVGTTGYGLFIDDNANLALWIGDAGGKVQKIASGKALLRKVWYLAAACYDAASGDQLWQSRLTQMANGYPITYAVDGMQYIAFGAGGPLGGSSWTSILPAALLPDLRNPRAGNAIFVFALPQ